MDGNYSVMSDRGCSYHFTTGVFLTIANIITTILGTFFNVLILVSSSRLHSVSNLFIINLTIADLLVCAAALPLNSVWTVQKTHGICVSQGVLYSRRVILTLSSCASLLILSWVSIERFVVISRPLRHKFYITTRRIRVVLAITWTCSLMYGAVAAFDDNAFITIFSTTATVTCSVVVTACYLHIFVVVWRQRRSQTELQRSQYQSQALEKQVAKTMALVIGVFVLCFAPLTIARQTVSKTSHGALHDWLLLLALSHSAVNPVIYFLRFRDYRAALKIIFYCKSIQVGYSRNSDKTCLDNNQTELCHLLCLRLHYLLNNSHVSNSAQ